MQFAAQGLDTSPRKREYNGIKKNLDAPTCSPCGLQRKNLHWLL
jgi:hypothetical protein